MKEKLDDKNIELTKILFELKQSFDVKKILSLNASQINKKAGKNFFAYVQRLALKNFVINICKIYETNSRNKLNSIPSILNYIESNNIAPENPEILKNFINKHNQRVAANGSFSPPLQAILKSFIASHKDALLQFKNFRDAKIAHAEDSEKKNINSLPSFATMEVLLAFAIDFYETIHQTYIGGNPVKHQEEKITLTSLLTVLAKVGFTDIKKEFEN